MPGSIRRNLRQPAPNSINRPKNLFHRLQKETFLMKLAFLFPGQGSQKVGMGSDLSRDFEPARRVFAEADEALGFDLSRLCFEGPEDELRLTANTQPAILTAA